jgi:hypothetical protein
VVVDAVRSATWCDDDADSDGARGSHRSVRADQSAAVSALLNVVLQPRVCGRTHRIEQSGVERSGEPSPVRVADDQLGFCEPGGFVLRHERELSSPSAASPTECLCAGLPRASPGRHGQKQLRLTW